VRTIKGDVNRASIAAALKNLKSVKGLAGDIPMHERLGYGPTFVNKAVRVNADNVNWQPVKKYTDAP
jgi:hypothetical protein